MALAPLFDQLQSDNGLTFAEFMAATPEERRAYLMTNNTPGLSPATDAAYSLRNITESGGWRPLTADQYRAILTSSGLDPALAQQIGDQLGGIIVRQQQTAADDNDFMSQLNQYALPAGALIAGGLGLAGAGAFGGGAAAGAAPMSEGAAWGAGLGGSDLAAMEAAVGLPASGGATVAGGLTGLEGLTAADLGLESLPFTTNPSLAELGGVISAETGLPVAGAGLGGLLSQAAKGAAEGTALSRFLNGNATTDDYLQLAGIAGATGLGVYGANQQSDAIRDIANQARADRAPFLGKSVEYLNDPNAYAAGPGKVFMDATLRGLSAKVGNPIDNPTALELATQAGLSDWRNAVLGFGNLGLAGEDTRANLGVQAANADAGALNSLGYGLQQVTQPKRRNLADVLGLA